MDPAANAGGSRGYELPALAALALAGCVVMTSLQLRHWRNSITLLQRASRWSRATSWPA